MKEQAHKLAHERALAAEEALACCRLCPRDCGVNRLAGECGACGLDDRVRVFRELLHPAEESRLNPSHQVYFSGCNLRCEFCSVLEWVETPDAANPMDLVLLLEQIAQRRRQGARTLNLLGGEPAVNVHGVLKLLAQVPVDTCVVWNSNMYYHDCVADWLDGLVDVTLADLKCASPDCSEAMLGARDYTEVVRHRILYAAESRELIVRCLVLPGHMDCCVKPNLEWLAETLPDVHVSLRTDYVPPIQPCHAPAGYGDPVDALRVQEICAQLGLRLVT